MTPRHAPRIKACWLVGLWLFVLCGSAAADITPPGWTYVHHRNVLEPGRFATQAGPTVAGGGYRFFVTAVRLLPVKPGGCFRLRTSFPSRLSAVPSAHVDAWLDIVAAHEDARTEAIYATARRTIPGFAMGRLPRQRALRAQSSPLRTIEAVFRIESIQNGTIRFALSERRVDAEGRPIGHAILALLGIATIGLTGLILTAVRRRRSGSAP